MTISSWLTTEQIQELVDLYFDQEHHREEHVYARRSQVKQAQEEILNPELLKSMTDEEFVNRTLELYKNVVSVPMYYKAIENHPQQVRGAVRYLLRSDDDIFEKVKNLRDRDGKHYRKGLGKTFWSLLIMALDSEQYPYWNNKTERALEALGMNYWTKKASPADIYQGVIEAYNNLLALHPEADLFALDHFMHYVTEMHGRNLLQEWKGEDTSLPDESDDWVQNILEWQEEGLPEERVSVRIEAEGEAQDLLETNLGQFDEDILRRFFELLNTDFYGGKRRRNRFSPAFVGGYENRIVEQIELFNKWIPLIWESEGNELKEVLGKFWEERPILYAGTILPTTVLYLRDSGQFNIWTDKMIEGVEAINGSLSSREDADAYYQYNKKVKEIRDRYNLQPQELDVILYRAAKFEEERSITENGEALPLTFDGFKKDTFSFLQDLRKNNEKEWFQSNKERYKSVLREPLRNLFSDVGARINHLDPNLETEAKYGKVMANISKRFADEEGPYHPYLWGAFYQADKKKQSSAQLFIGVHPDRVSIGVGVGEMAREELSTFNANISKNPKIFFSQIKPLLERNFVLTTYESHTEQEHTEIKITSIDDVSKLSELSYVNIKRDYTPSYESLYKPELALELADAFEALYPLYLFFISGDIEEDIAPFVIDGAPEDLEPDEQYTFEDLLSDIYLDVDFVDRLEILLKDKGQVVYYGPPGTGKTYVAKKFAKYFVSETGGDTQIVQFHPSYAYEEFVEGIRPHSEKGQLSYPVERGVFYRFCETARRNQEQRYVMIIDEINRGSLPRIFGELLYLLEYRGEEETVTLPYSKKRFAIPKNLYIIGTMNTADRSIALVDHALRRRFHFIPFKPDSEILLTWLQNQGHERMAWVADLLDKLNSQLDQDQIDWHLHIGHSHWMVPDGELDEARVKLIWNHSIMPTLQEYFYKSSERLGRYGFERLKELVT